MENTQRKPDETLADLILVELFPDKALSASEICDKIREKRGDKNGTLTPVVSRVLGELVETFYIKGDRIREDKRVIVYRLLENGINDARVSLFKRAVYTTKKWDREMTLSLMRGLGMMPSEKKEEPK